MKYIKLNNNTRIPVIGMGTYPLNRWPLVKAIINAYNLGCKSIDTSESYGNERWIGLATKFLKIFGVNDIYIITKLSNTAQREGNVRKSLKDSMKKLGVNQVDLYLMHWPNPDTYLESWKEMEVLYKEGLVKAIGVCNFHQHHLEKLLEIAEIKPVINQIELHPLLTQKPLREYCENNGIRVQSYSPLARMEPKLIGHPILLRLSVKYQKTVPQIILKWNIENEIITIPKSGNRKRIKQNFDIFDFELKREELSEIDSINENYRVRHDPDTVDYYKV